MTTPWSFDTRLLYFFHSNHQALSKARLRRMGLLATADTGLLYSHSLGCCLLNTIRNLSKQLLTHICSKFAKICTQTMRHYREYLNIGTGISNYATSARLECVGVALKMKQKTLTAAAVVYSNI